MQPVSCREKYDIQTTPQNQVGAAPAFLLITKVLLVHEHKSIFQIRLNDYDAKNKVPILWSRCNADFC